MACLIPTIKSKRKASTADADGFYPVARGVLLLGRRMDVRPPRGIGGRQGMLRYTRFDCASESASASVSEESVIR